MNLNDIKNKFPGISATRSVDAASGADSNAYLSDRSTSGVSSGTKPAAKSAAITPERIAAMSPEDRAAYESLLAKRRERKARRLRKARRTLFIEIAVMIVMIAGCVHLLHTHPLGNSGTGSSGGSIISDPYLAEDYLGSEETDGDDPMVEVARAELGNYAGEKFWSWYGFDYQVDWCAIFVSWVADQCGYLDKGLAPKFAVVNDGAYFFQVNGDWAEAGTTPEAGDVIFFDKDEDGGMDHVGIVAGVYKNRVFTIEGNTGYAEHGGDEDAGSVDDSDDYYGECLRRAYDVDSPVIWGYGIIDDASGDSDDSSDA